ncbi:MAG TPA: hypothetical protein VM143_07870 [Acidimicrobiales bacterium]|nr:hypothetical protein [Acidimicrobiales bacterium]
MVALFQRWEPVVEPSSLVVDARAEVARLEAGLSRALLSTPPSEVRRIAAGAARAEAAVARWQARVGERPVLDADADAAVSAAIVAVTAARADQNVALYERHKVLAIGNTVGIFALGLAGGLIGLGVPPMELPVAVAVVSAAGGPLTAGWLATQRCSIAARDVGTARSRWAAALAATGAGTMGELSARRLAVAAWERRCREAAAAVEAARPHQRPWYRLAGPGVSPRDVDEVLARVEELRGALLRLFGALLAERVEGSALAVLAPPAEVAAPESPPSWLDDALSRLRGNKLRLWR